MESYVASFHLSVEERFLFKEATGLSAELARGAKDLRAEHERVKALVSRFKQLSGRKEAYDDGTLAVVAKQLVESITRHLLREEETYFPRIEEALSMERDAEMLREIERYTASKFGSDYLRQFEDKAVRIQDEVLGPGHYQGVQ
jgi:hemerythrin-like domain-containing protein